MIKLITNQPPLIEDSDVVLSTMEECAAYCRGVSMLAIDSETAGMDYFSKPMVMFQIGTPEVQFVIDTRSHSLEPLKPILESMHILKIGQNLKFDYKFLKILGIELENVYDTMLAEQVLNCGRDGVGYSLEALALRYCNKQLNKAERNKFIGLNRAPFTISQIKYGAEDVEFLFRIRETQLQQAENDELLATITLENNALLALADIEFNGMKLDTKHWLELGKANKKCLIDARKGLDNIIMSDEIFSQFIVRNYQTDTFMSDEEIRKVGINWDSPSQVLRVFKIVDNTLENVDGKKLSEIAYKHEIVSKYIDYKKLSKLVGTYGEDFLKYINKTSGKIHTEIYQILETGRISSNNPNMQNIPSDNRYRNCFIPEHEGWVFVSGDYTGQELTIIATKSKDPIWMEALRNGWDFDKVFAI